MYGLDWRHKGRQRLPTLETQIENHADSGCTRVQKAFGSRKRANTR
jgi:hypothetical protein